MAVSWRALSIAIVWSAALRAAPFVGSVHTPRSLRDVVPAGALADAEDTFESIQWSSERWLWEVEVADRSGGRCFCGSFATQREAARAADAAQLALDQMHPQEDGKRCWQRNLPKETVYQDEVDLMLEILRGERGPPEVQD
ncbi:unnamed protein product [Effrenium voratum]|nr:unnamed protein product [Effrenium voratum]